MTRADTTNSLLSLIYKVNELPQKKATEFELVPDARALEALRNELELLGLRKLRLKGSLAPSGKSDWHLKAQLGATVVQPCIVSLEPVTTRIEEPVERYFAAETTQDFDEEMEMPEDDNVEPLESSIDIGAILMEALSLALPLYPKAVESEQSNHVFTEPGKTPMTDEDTKPFAGLASLRDSLKKKEE